MLLCNESDCTGCGACYSVCPKHSITMCEDSKGFLLPIIDETVCIGCHMCERTCPVLNLTWIKNTPLSIVACWHKDHDIRYESSSGGAFSAIAEKIIEMGGVVWGAMWSENLTLEYSYVDNCSDLSLLRGSKYVQSKVGDCYLKIKEQLDENKKVLFCGTPCHIKGLYSIVGGHKNLTTIDLICHGVSSPGVFRDYIDWIEKNKAIRIKDYRFRNKQFGTSYNVATMCLSNSDKRYVLSGRDNSFSFLYSKGYIMRECCQNCNFNGTNRISDFTIADYRNDDTRITLDEVTKGVSILMANTKNAEQLLQKLNIQSIEQSLESVVKTNPNYTHSNKIVIPQDFWGDHTSFSYDRWVKKYGKETWGDKIKTFILLVFGPKFFNFLKGI